MEFYTSMGPNPRVVRVFLAEKGLDIPVQKIDLRSGENRLPPYVEQINRTGELPALALENGETICEITAICEYVEDTHPEPPLIGSTAEEKAETRMWTRRVDLNIAEPLGQSYRAGDGYAFFKDRRPVIDGGSAALQSFAQKNLTWLDGQMANKTWICGERFTLADVLLYCFVDFSAKVGQPMNEKNTNIMSWFDRVGERPSLKT